jgi:glucose-6-phosphate isomerase
MEWISQMKDSLLDSDLENNIALQLAHTQYKYYREWKNICVFFPYSSRLFQIWEWYKQLMGESIGKNGEGVTLTSSLWVTDQHSQLQLYQDGPKDKLYLFLDILDTTNDIQVSNDIPNFTFQKLLNIEKYGTMTSLQNEWHPVCNISLDTLDEKHIAKLLYILMFQIAYLWELFEINAFDQPGVEKSKIITKQKLQEEFWDIDIFSKAFYD